MFLCLRITLFILFAIVSSHATAAALGDATWYQRDGANQPVIQLYFYWSQKCPHCLEALPFVEQLATQRPDVVLHSYQLVGEPENVTRYELMASALGQVAQSVPAFFVCNMMLTGYDKDITPRQIESLINRCQQHLGTNKNLDNFASSENEPLLLHLPLLGNVEAGVSSLPLMTMIIAGVDAFNPCAFFVLMFLLSLLLHTRSRKRMLLVGGVFVFFSGLLYFLFMTAWLNLFRVIGHLDAITMIAALVAIAVGLINVKDFFWFKQGVSLTISANAKPKLFERMRGLLQAQSLTTLLAATVGLALFANLYEFLCTAGFPMVYTRILTLSELSSTQYYLYLIFYNLIYIIPLLIIVLVFVVTMGARKLQKREGRGLKLVSGTMMLTLGVILFVAPSLLQNLPATLVTILVAVALALLLAFIHRVGFEQRNRH